MNIRQAKVNDIEMIMPVFDEARRFMEASGNPNQWINGYPSKDLIVSNINAGDFYVCLSDASIIGVFYFHIGVDVTYNTIYGGSWLNDAPYGVVHRIASNGRQKRLSDTVYDWCLQQCGNLRIDTHRENVVMQNSLRRNGFLYCGVIYLADGRERLAFQKTITR